MSFIRCILESPYAAPKALRDELGRARAQLADQQGLGCTRQLEFVIGLREEKVREAEAQHLRYLKALARHAFSQGFAPFSSHALFTQWLDDHNAEERTQGIQAGFAWAEGVQVVLVGVDLGVSTGMELGLKLHRQAGREVREVHLGADWGRKAWDRDPSGVLTGSERRRS